MKPEKETHCSQITGNHNIADFSTGTKRGFLADIGYINIVRVLKENMINLNFYTLKIPFKCESKWNNFGQKPETFISDRPEVKNNKSVMHIIKSRVITQRKVKEWKWICSQGSGIKIINLNGWNEPNSRLR